MAKSSKKRNLTPETPTDTTPLSVECKVIRLGVRHTGQSAGGIHLIDLLQALKMENESLLNLVERHQEQSRCDRVGQESIFK